METPRVTVGIAAIVVVLGVIAGCDSYTPPTAPSPPSDPPLTEPIPDPPVETLPAITTSGTMFLAGGAPFRWIGVTAFDAPRRVAEGDESYLAWAASMGFTLVRVVPASTFRTPRTPEEGVREIGPFLDAAARHGLYVEVVVAVDGVPYGFTESSLIAYASALSREVNRRSNVVVEAINEIGHATQPRFLEDPRVQRSICDLFVAPCSAGSSHGGQRPRWDAGDYATHHADRSKTPDENAAIMRAAQSAWHIPLVDDEWRGFGPVERWPSRSADPTLAAAQARAARANRLGGSTLHLDSGLEAHVPTSPVELDAARLFIAELRR